MGVKTSAHKQNQECNGVNEGPEARAPHHLFCFYLFLFYFLFLLERQRRGRPSLIEGVFFCFFFVFLNLLPIRIHHYTITRRPGHPLFGILGAEGIGPDTVAFGGPAILVELKE
jgi:hypothetical protein